MITARRRGASWPCLLAGCWFSTATLSKARREIVTPFSATALIRSSSIKLPFWSYQQSMTAVASKPAKSCIPARMLSGIISSSCALPLMEYGERVASRRSHPRQCRRHPYPGEVDRACVAASGAPLSAASGDPGPTFDLLVSCCRNRQSHRRLSLEEKPDWMLEMCFLYNVPGSRHRESVKLVPLDYDMPLEDSFLHKSFIVTNKDFAVATKDRSSMTNSPITIKFRMVRTRKDNLATLSISYNSPDSLAISAVATRKFLRRSMCVSSTSYMLTPCVKTILQIQVGVYDREMSKDKLMASFGNFETSLAPGAFWRVPMSGLTSAVKVHSSSFTSLA
ncbi:hypothetical protein SELMODRAFT_417339 [Selaginella moellendorffii]|uniref:Uncharacterized protein n=1 Tax=Selaginella moellendorffii TaxID=88036 RepID=D8S1X1_SELML|nr:hypothetical protein SELMODRAFT_417339 [Selaginella moellendorffii]